MDFYPKTLVCESCKAGITFIGPSKSAIASMGDKIESKKIAKSANVNTFLVILE